MSLFENMPEESSWYAVKTQTKREHIAAAAIRTRTGIQVFCPRISYAKKTRRGRVHFREALFPGYLFAFCELRENYRHLLAIEGVVQIVHFGSRIAPVPSPFIEELKEEFLNGDLHEEPDPGLAVGSEVVVLDGPFVDLRAVVSGLIPARQRVELLLEFLGRQLHVEIQEASVMSEHGEPKRFILKMRK